MHQEVTTRDGNRNKKIDCKAYFYTKSETEFNQHQ